MAARRQGEKKVKTDNITRYTYNSVVTSHFCLLVLTGGSRYSILVAKHIYLNKIIFSLLSVL